MNKYLVVDKQEGFSFKCDGPFEVLEAVGCDDCTWDEMLIKCKDTYEIIEYTGELRWILN